MSATLVDDGDMETANLFANGPGLLETRPVPDETASPLQNIQPDRTITWQDQLVVQNEVGPDKKVAKKIVTIRGLPRVIDRIQESSLDAVDRIIVWMKPRPGESGAPAGAATASLSSTSTTKKSSGSGSSTSQSGNFQIEHLLAVRDAHLVAPAKDLKARERLDADFEESPSAPIVTRSTAAPSPQPAGPVNAQEGGEAATVQNDAPAKDKKTDPYTAVLANRVRAKILVDPNSTTANTQSGDRAKPTSPSLASNSANSNAKYEVREVRLFGAVTMHQDPAPGKIKGQDASGEALVLINEGPGKVIFDLYHRDPTHDQAKLAQRGPWPNARVTTEDMDIEGQVLKVNQKTDQAWVFGPGKLVQLTDRGVLTDRTPDNPEQESDQPEGQGEDSRKDKVTRPAKPRMRAGKLLTEKVPLTITWGEKMTFNGITTDPENRPAAKAVFYKNVRAEMEDSLLYCTETMTTYTDQPIPLAEVGKMSQSAAAANSQKKPVQGSGAGEGDEDESTKPKPDLALIDCVGKAIAISRKVDPDRPVLISLQKIVGERLIYDRRTGDFHVPGPGIVYLYDRNNDANATPGLNPQDPVANQRTIIRTSGPPSGRPSGTKPGAKRKPARPATASSDTDKKQTPSSPRNALQPLILTQIEFAREMKGRFGTGKEADKTETRWAEFFTNVQAARAPVRNELVTFSFDRCPRDSYFLTSQTLRVVTEPPPPGSPENTPARNFLKGWDDALARTKDTTIQADEITYDSYNDLIYARSLEGKPVQVLQQAAAGQPGSPMRADAVRVNPKTGAADFWGPQAIQMLEAKTGARPAPVAPPDPNAKPPKTPKTPYRTPRSSGERRGFTGQ
jgi:hypothetical protein